MSDLAVRTFQGLPLTVQQHEGREWFRATDLLKLTGKKKAALHKLVGDLPASERCLLKVDTLGGTQDSAFITRAGAAEILLRSHSPARLPFIDWLLQEQGLAPALDPARVTVLEQMVAAQTTALTSLHARLLRLENTAAKQAAKKALPKPRTAALADLPEAEIDAFLQAWRQHYGSQHVSSATLHEMATAGGHMRSLFAACNTTRGEQTRLGIWLKSLPGVRYHRTARTRKWRLGAEVVDIQSRRGA